MLNNLFISMNSFRYQQLDNYQRRSPEQKHFGVNLLVRRLVGRSAGPLGGCEFGIMIGISKMRINIFCLCLMFACGCVNKEIVKPEYLVSDSTKDVLITTNSGKWILMYSNNYHIVRIDSAKYISGKGTLIKDISQSISSPFDGQIAFSEIAQIETREKSVFYYSGYYIFAGATAFILFIALVFHGHGPGG
jgi:hypothetical protein